MAVVKAKEKEMKDEKEAERQVSTAIYEIVWALMLTWSCRGGYKQ